MSILDAQRYAENMTRTEIADALKNGHPLVPGFLVADAAKQMEENDALVKVLEQQAGLPQPGQTISDKLEAYLREPISERRVAQQQPGVGGLNLMPGPPGVGGPMPEPTVPGGAGGPMPGTQRGPQGVGAPMRSGGVVGFQEGGYADEMTDGDFEDDVFGPFNDPWVRGTDWLRPKSELDYALLAASLPALASGLGSPAGVLGLGGYGLRKGAQQLVKMGAQKAAPALARWAPGMGQAVRRSIGSDAWKPGAGKLGVAWSMAKHPFRTAAGGIGSLTPFGKTSIAQFIGTPLARMSTQGGVRSRISNLLTGGAERIAPGARSIPTALMGQRAGARGLMAAYGAYLYGGEPLSGEDIKAIEDLTDEERAALEKHVRELNAVGLQERRPPEAEAGGGMYQDLFGKIREYQAAASIPSESEKNRYKLDEDRAKDLRGRRAGLEALMPTAEEDALRGRGVSFGALSKVLARTGDPRKRQDFAQIGEAISSETDRQLRQRLGFEDKLAGIDTDIYGVEGQGLDRRALRERAGDAFKLLELKGMHAQADAEAARQNALLVAALRQGSDSNIYSGRNIPSIIAFLNSVESQEYLTEESRQIIAQNVRRALTGMSSGGSGKLAERMGQAQGRV